MTRINRKVLKSIGELSSFKFLLVFYLVFFIISAIIMGLVWLGLYFFGINIADMLQFNLQNFGLSDFGLLNLGGGSVLYAVVAIIVGLAASVFYAAFGTFMVWIVNVILRISGGIELRFIEREDIVKSE